MPFKSLAQQRFLESSASPLTPAQKKDFEQSTKSYGTLPEHVEKAKPTATVRSAAEAPKPARKMHGDGSGHWSGR